MKKILFLTFMLFFTALVFAAEVQRVAILEVVDKEGRLNYSQKLVLRSNLAKAITNTPGYEGFDRTDIDAIMSEHEFQRTGMVSHDQIKKLGEMAGVKLILVAEAALTGDNKMFVAVKLLDVETAKVVKTDNANVGLASDEMKSGCEEIARALFEKKKLFAKKQTTPAPQQQVVTQVIYQQAPQQAAAQPQAQQKVQAQPAPQINGQVTRLSNKEYLYRGTTMDKRGYEKFLYNSCTPAYKQYKLGRKLTAAGWGCASAGLVMIIIGAPLTALELPEVGSPFVAIGAISLATSIPLFTVGAIKKKKSVDIYNSQCISENKIMEFKLISGQNGLGIAMNF